jgi:hypothetical protein
VSDDDTLQFHKFRKLLPNVPDLSPLECNVWNEVNIISALKKINNNSSLCGVTATKLNVYGLSCNNITSDEPSTNEKRGSSHNPRKPESDSA